MGRAFLPHGGAFFSALTAQRYVKHDFFIEDLGQPPGWFSAHRYHYSCLRCGWTFRIENRGGRVQALGEDHQPLSAFENTRRTRTFADGPCEAFSAEAPSVPVRDAVKPAATRARLAFRRRFDGIAEIIPAK
jgi:hypothetical protein